VVASVIEWIRKKGGEGEAATVVARGLRIGGDAEWLRMILQSRQDVNDPLRACLPSERLQARDLT
jgi:hypothetical protein